MEPQSPPKRMTRARAAAKASTTDSSSSSTVSRAKSATASSRARTASTATATTASAAAKRKLRTEDVDSDNEHDELGLDRPQPPTMQKVVRAARGRPRKTPVEPEQTQEPAPTAPAPRPRGRPPTKKVTTVSEAPKETKEPARPSSRASTVTAPTAATQARATRTKKTVTLVDEAADAEEPAKKRATRARATSASVAAPTTTRISVRSASAVVATKTTTAPKKKVTFEEPEKENIAPAATIVKGEKVPAAKSGSETTPAGLKAKPARRAAATTKAASASATAAAPRGRVASGNAASDRSATPLSPKKVTQVRLARDFDVDSEDELGASDESHLKPFERSPTKPSMAAGITPAERNKALTNAGLDLESSTRDITANIATLPAPELQGGLLTSPARRPAQSPVKEGLMTSPARRLEGLAPMDGILASKNSSNNNSNGGSNNNASTSVLFSPAKRFPVHSKPQSAGGDTLRSPMKLSLLQTPAKRPASPVKAAILLQRPDMKPSTLRAQAEVIASSPEPKSTPVPGQSSMGEIQEEAEDGDAEGDETDVEASDADVDEDDHESDAENNEKTESLTQMLHEMANDAASAMPESPSRRRFPGRLSAVVPREVDPSQQAIDEEPVPEDILSRGEPMDVDESIGAATLLVAMSPPKPKAPSGVFGLRAKDLDACNGDDDVDSDAEVTTCLPFMSNDDMPATPCPAKSTRSSKTPSSRSGRISMGGQSTAKRPKMGKFGFTPLADQLNGWKVRSPAKAQATPTPAAIEPKNIETQTEDEKTEDEKTEDEKTEDEKTEDEKTEDEKTEDEAAETAEAVEEVSNESVAEVSVEVSEVPVVQSYFDDAMVGHSQLSSRRQSEVTVPTGDKECVGLMDNVVLQDEIETPEFDEDLVVTEEDLELAQEANDMSLMAPAELEEMINLPQSSDDAMSEASQDYGDENAIPIDPALLADSNGLPVAVPPVTPQRVLTRTFHTVSKVPLKPADESTPQPRRRSMSISRLPTSSRRRSSMSSANNAATSTSANTSPSKRSDNGRGLTRSATVISYSPTKKEGRRSSIRDSRRKSRRESFGGPALTLEDALFDSSEDETPESPTPQVSVTAPSAPVTPNKNEVSWSTAGTPARTPRRDLDPALLRGAVVFVDVHTTEGSDASAIFVELLTQMGAQCVKTWSWNPSSSPSDKNDGSSRVGITHVVFKDGSRRTLDKVRESNGLVQCVGVSWVLDCERANQWQEEAPYYIDTALVSRGGGRRRKSMEPQALSNMNGLLVETPPKQTGGPSAAIRECRTAPPAPSTPMNRRDSTLWMRTPDDEDSAEKRRSYGAVGGDENDVDGYGEPDWGMSAILTPVPKTPAPETIARYAANISPSSPYGSDAGNSSYYNDGDDTLNSMQFDQGPLVTRTCPPKQRSTSYHELGAGILSREKDEGVLMRLMAARRKSLQFAPKIASPLSKAWN